MERVPYTNQELADMILIYGECRKNQRQAAVLYAERFPDRRHPGHGFFRSLHVRLCQFGSFHAVKRIAVRRKAQEIINAVRAAVLNNPHTSTRTIGHDLHMDHTKVHRIIKKELKLHPFKRHTNQKLFPADFPRRRAFCDWILEQIDDEDVANDAFLKTILWTDECIFRSDGMINRHNEHHYAEENPRCRKTIHVQHQFSVNVWMGILDDKIIGPYFFPEKAVNAQVYAAFLEETLSHLLEDVSLVLRMNTIFQQDGHPAHTSVVARNILNRKFPNKWIGIHSNLHEWPPRSPDLTPLDFFLWGYLKNKIYQTLPADKNDLINRIQTATLEINPAMLGRVRESFVRRVFLCAEQNGEYFEHLL